MCTFTFIFRKKCVKTGAFYCKKCDYTTINLVKNVQN